MPSKNKNGYVDPLPSCNKHRRINMKKLKEINSKTLYEKDPYLVEICAGGAEYKDMGIAFTDYDKV